MDEKTHQKIAVFEYFLYKLYTWYGEEYIRHNGNYKNDLGLPYGAYNKFSKHSAFCLFYLFILASKQKNMTTNIRDLSLIDLFDNIHITPIGYREVDVYTYLTNNNDTLSACKFVKDEETGHRLEFFKGYQIQCTNEQKKSVDTAFDVLKSHNTWLILKGNFDLIELILIQSSHRKNKKHMKEDNVLSYKLSKDEIINEWPIYNY